MAYSTRRKSVNLSLLGIRIPINRPSQRSPPTSTISPSTSATTTTSSTASSASDPTDRDEQSFPPTKRPKRSHSEAIPLKLQSLTVNSPKSPCRPSTALAPTAHTPPPTPPPSDDNSSKCYPKVDVTNINDDVVIATIELLEKNNNRPYLLKELAAAISSYVHVVETSANRSAIISSRLTNFMKRPWTSTAPCPLGKDLIGTHPKRLYFYLSGRPHLDFPDPEPRLSISAAAAVARVISPPLTTASVTDDSEDVGRRRAQLSPSPEPALVDHCMDFENSNLSRANSKSIASSATSINGQGAPPALERDEHEFTQCAYALQLLRRTSDRPIDYRMEFTAPPEYSSILGDDGLSDLLTRKPAVVPFNSPALPAEKNIPPPLNLASLVDTPYVWTELRSPETVNLKELDTLFERY